MSSRIPTLAATVAAVLYIAGAAFLITGDRNSTGGGHWIRLDGLLSALVTLPVWAACQMAGYRLNFRSNLHMGTAVALCGGLVFLLTRVAVSLGLRLLVVFGFRSA